MEFHIRRRGSPPTPTRTWPFAVLEIDNWDDYGFQTMYRLVLYLAPEASGQSVGNVKILQLGQESGRPNLPYSFQSLKQEFISLGQDHEYYEALSRTDPDVARDVLSSLNDIVYRPKLRSRFEGERGLRDSLFRFSSATAAASTAGAILQARTVRLPSVVRFEASTSVGGNAFRADFEWVTDSILPGHVAALIGYNGSGKTQLLANLAFISATTGASLSEDNSALYGTVLRNSLGTFSGIIAISYSAFDTFALPGSDDDRARSEETGSSLGYSYVGLRKPQYRDSSPSSGGYELRSPSEIASDFRSALVLAKTKERAGALSEALAVLLREPSFIRGGLTEDSFSDVENSVALFECLSSGHKIVLNVVVRLVGQLQPRTLVLIDEPESHLHPPLIAALLSAVNSAVKRQDSLAIVATHSPVVLQEIPARHVRLLRRSGTLTSFERLDSETFAENLGYLTRAVFNLDSSATDYQEVLARMHEARLTESIEQLFPLGLSQQGRAVLAALEATSSGDATD